MQIFISSIACIHMLVNTFAQTSLKIMFRISLIFTFYAHAQSTNCNFKIDAKVKRDSYKK